MNEPVTTNRVPLSRRRDKPQLSCNLCRRRKLRCDRRQPCSYCTSRNEECVYPAKTPTLPGTTSGQGLQQRLDHLEHLVASYVQQSQQSLARVSDVQDVDAGRLPPHDDGSLHIDSQEQLYLDGDHWHAILDSIADVRKELAKHEADEQNLHRTPDTDGDLPPSGSHARLLYGYDRLMSRSEIVAALPPRQVVDRYVAHYFQEQELVSCMLHGPTFMSEYKAFWANPGQTSIIWIGLLLGMIAITASAMSIESVDGVNPALQYRECIVHCLLTGEYTIGGPYVLEALIHYNYVEFAKQTDANQDMRYLMSLEVNLALRMGYHRDPSHFKGITPFQGEMRRRVWSTILLADVQISSQMGMPHMITQTRYDTAEPRNLNDDDLTNDLSELPPSRPASEYTVATKLIARHRMLVGLGTILDLTANVKPCSYTDIMRVDREFRDILADLPDPMRWRPLSASLMDSPQMIMSRLFVDQLFHKGQVLLHRRYLSLRPSQNDQDAYRYSRDACLDACLGLLRYQMIMDEETQPGGLLYSLRWRKSSITTAQYLTATMILCSVLHRDELIERNEEVTIALRSAQAIWQRTSTISTEARKAAETVKYVLAAFDTKQQDASVTQTGQLIHPPADDVAAMFDLNAMFNFDAEIVDANMTLNDWVMSGGQGWDFG